MPTVAVDQPHAPRFRIGRTIPATRQCQSHSVSGTEHAGVSNLEATRTLARCFLPPSPHRSATATPGPRPRLSVKSTRARVSAPPSWPDPGSPHTSYLIIARPRPLIPSHQYRTRQVLALPACHSRAGSSRLPFAGCSPAAGGMLAALSRGQRACLYTSPLSWYSPSSKLTGAEHPGKQCGHLESRPPWQTLACPLLIPPPQTRPGGGAGLGLGERHGPRLEVSLPRQVPRAETRRVVVQGVGIQRSPLMRH
ncbi:hypothetical protein F5X68DRAFT_60932 [Plectosphaerella plurivora]|uniref:Uncharacterized protein n=1 Tax=Plectosphaerella plurivora TaxID=936078 RepID=A0A9P9A6B8_9PEZI|nr:hypothetical protein F5X68DRAFT_60932 [Plectosphaerella plurivora]